MDIDGRGGNAFFGAGEISVPSYTWDVVAAGEVGVVIQLR
jgi:hypothetical protein